MVSIPDANNGIIISRNSWFSGNLPVLFFKDDDIKKKRPHKVRTDTNAPEMVTIAKLSELTGLSEYCIRRMCKQNEIKYIKAGAKILINYDRFLDYLNGKE